MGKGPPVLTVVDVQKGLDDASHGERNNPDAESNIALLLATWRHKGWPVVHVRHDSVASDSALRPGLPGHEIKQEARPLPGEVQFTKSANSAFSATGLEDYLRIQGAETMVIVGLTSDHCVSATTRAASDLGFDVTLVSDATAAHERTGHDGTRYPADLVHKISLASLNGEFCKVRSTHQVLGESDHTD